MSPVFDQDIAQEIERLTRAEMPKVKKDAADLERVAAENARLLQREQK